MKKVSPIKKAALLAPDQSSMAAVQMTPPAQTNSGAAGAGGVGLTVRIEINLPPGGDQATYGAIFKSIRENLLNGNSA